MKKIEHPYQIPDSERRNDLRILPFTQNGIEYNHCFVLLNPFYKRKKRFKNFNKQKPNWIEGRKSEIKKDYEKYYWSEFTESSQINDIKEIIHCFYVYDSNYIERFQKVKKSVWEAFQETISDKQLLWNADSHISVLTIDTILEALKKLDYDNLALYDIFKNDLIFKKTDELKISENDFPSEFRLVTEDKQLLFYQEYEHYETFIYSTDLKLLNSFLKLTDFEGFFATNKTTALWSEVEYKDGDKILTIKNE